MSVYKMYLQNAASGSEISCEIQIKHTIKQ